VYHERTQRLVSNQTKTYKRSDRLIRSHSIAGEPLIPMKNARLDPRQRKLKELARICLTNSATRHSHRKHYHIPRLSPPWHVIQKRQHNRKLFQLPKSEPADHNSLCSTLTHCNPSNPRYITPSVSLDGPLRVMEHRMVAIDQVRFFVAIGLRYRLCL
jgi:hypothetical protein